MAAQAVRNGELVETNPLVRPGQLEKVLRLPNSAPFVLRSRGPRDLDEVPPDEVGALLGRIRGDGGVTEEEAKRALLDAYGLKRLTPDVDKFLSSCAALGGRSGADQID